MKLLLILFTPLFLFSKTFTIKCPNTIHGVNMESISYLDYYFYLAVWGEEYDPEYPYFSGEMDLVNYYITIYDSDSAACGGSLNANILYEVNCNDYSSSHCWDIPYGIGNEVILTVEKDGLYTNNLIHVNSYPCMPKDTKNVTVGYYDDYREQGYINFNLNNISYTKVYVLTEEEATTQRTTCDTSLVPYVDNWENIIDSQKSNIEKSTADTFHFNFNLDGSLNVLQNAIYKLGTASFNSLHNVNLEDLTLSNIGNSFSFDNNLDVDSVSSQLNYESILSNVLDKYSSVFGFGGYGIAPAPIDFSLLGNTYKAFDITLYEDYVSMIRTMFGSFAYLWGAILVIRDNL